MKSSRSPASRLRIPPYVWDVCGGVCGGLLGCASGAGFGLLLGTVEATIASTIVGGLFGFLVGYFLGGAAAFLQDIIDRVVGAKARWPLISASVFAVGAGLWIATLGGNEWPVIVMSGTIAFVLLYGASCVIERAIVVVTVLSKK